MNQLSNKSYPWLVNIVHTYDAYEQAVSMNGWDVSYDQLSTGDFAGFTTDIQFLDIQILRERYDRSVHQSGTCTLGKRAFGTYFTAEGDSGFNGCKIKMGDISTLIGGERMDFITPTKVDMVGITVDSNILESYVESVGNFDINKRLANFHIIRSCHSQTSLSDFLNSITKMLEISPDSLKHSEMQRSLQDTILSNLISIVETSDELIKTRPSYETRRKVVERAKTYVNSHCDSPVTIEELCKVAGASQRTLQYCFEDVLMTNPVQYLRKMRLNGVRRDLKCSPTGSLTVQDAAEKWGFWHLSRLARDYRDLFGELPSQTLLSK